MLFHGAIPTGPDATSKKFNFLASCDVFLHPSRWEAGIPFSVLDALELAKPCLVSSGSFFGSFFQQYPAGMQVPPTREGVANGLLYMAEASADQLQAMGACGRHAVLQEFSGNARRKNFFRPMIADSCRYRCGDSGKLQSNTQNWGAGADEPLANSPNVFLDHFTSRLQGAPMDSSGAGSAMGVVSHERANGHSSSFRLHHRVSTHGWHGTESLLFSRTSR